MHEKIADEKTLLLQIAAGDQHAFAQLFSARRTTIYIAALRLTQSAPLAEEIVQDVFLKIWIKRASLPQIEQFSAWLFTIAQNTIYSAMRKKHREISIEREIKTLTTIPTLTSTADDPQPAYQQMLEEAVDHLPAKQKDTFILIKIEGLKRTQAASILKVSAETVKSNLEHAIRNIKAYCMAHPTPTTASGRKPPSAS